MYRILLWGALFLICFASPTAAEKNKSLQEQIDEVPSGGTLILKEMKYQDPILLSKPMTLEGTGKTIISTCSDEPVIKIIGENVTVKNLKIESCSQSEEIGAIQIEGKYHRLENVKISTTEYGIKLNESYHSIINNVEINGKRNKNGIDLWNSSENMITESTIRNVYDGIYLENSNGNKIWNNKVTKARYGYHLMFSDQNNLKRNYSGNNSTGAMIMTTNETVLDNNEFMNNNENVHSQGLLVYDSYHARIVNNTISHNRVGMFLDNSKQNLLEGNFLSQNFIGMQLREFHNNELSQNNLIGNVYDSQAIQSSDNKINNNYWDSSLKLDISGKGTSIIPYFSDPYFLTLTSTTPEFQLFFHSPGMLVMEKLLKSEENNLLKDNSPMMEPTKSWRPNELPNHLLWLISFLMIFISFIFFRMGRKEI